MKVVVSCPGKIHLLGEHAVVYQRPGIIAAIGLRTKVTLVTNQAKSEKLSSFAKASKDKKVKNCNSKLKNKITLVDKNLKFQEETTLEEILIKTKWERERWEEQGEIMKNPLDLIKISIGETFNYFKIRDLDEGFSLEIKSEIPMGVGLGSSSAIATAVVGAVYKIVQSSKIINKLFNNRDLDNIYKIALEVEKRVHGNPSGGDTAAVVYGGLIWFQKISETEKIIKSLSIKIPREIAENFLLIDTRKPKEGTGEMVASVRKLYEEKPEIVAKFLDMQEKLVEELLPVLKKGEEKELIRIIRDGERNLESIGVVSPYVGNIIREIEKVGGAAKICGGGGKTRGTGILLAYGRDIQKVKEIAEKYGLKCFEVWLGGEGIKQISNF